jgi:hypothetical protein
MSINYHNGLKKCHYLEIECEYNKTKILLYLFQRE